MVISEPQAPPVGFALEGRESFQAGCGCALQALSFLNWKVENVHCRAWWLLGKAQESVLLLDRMGTLKSVHTSSSRDLGGAVFCSKSLTPLS